MAMVVKAHLPPSQGLGELIEVALDLAGHFQAPERGLEGMDAEGSPDVALASQDCRGCVKLWWVTPHGNRPPKTRGKGMG